MPDPREHLSLRELLEMQRLAKEAHDAERCVVCDKPGVCNDPGAWMLMTDRFVFWAHGRCYQGHGDC